MVSYEYLRDVHSLTCGIQGFLGAEAENLHGFGQLDSVLVRDLVTRIHMKDQLTDWHLRSVREDHAFPCFDHSILGINPHDEVIEEKGVRILIDPKAVMFLLGTEMDYKVDKLASQFVFNNPNQTAACGCGESVQIEPAVDTAQPQA